MNVSLPRTLVLAASLAAFSACGGASRPDVEKPDEDCIPGLPGCAAPEQREARVPDDLAAKAIALVEATPISVGTIVPPDPAATTPKETRKGKKEEPAPVEPPPPVIEQRASTIKALLAEGFLAEALSASLLVDGAWVVTANGPAPATGDYRGQVRVVWHCPAGASGVGPAWLVDAGSGRVEPDNRYARALHDAHDPARVESIRIELARVAALVAGAGAWSEAEGIPLAAVALRTIGERSSGEYDVVGWTVEDRPRWGWVAAFHWTEAGQPHTAEWRIVDLDRSPFPQPTNEDAAAITASASSFLEWKPVSVVPEAYDIDPNAPRDQRWSKKASDGCKKRPETCQALGLVLQQRDLVTALQWYLTESPASRRQFEQCTAQRKCAWRLGEATDGRFPVSYQYPGEDGDELITFAVDLATGGVHAGDEIAETLLRAARPRGYAGKRFGWFFDRWPTDPEMTYLFDDALAEQRELQLTASWQGSGHKGGSTAALQLDLSEDDGTAALDDDEVFGPIYASAFLEKAQRCIDNPASPAEKRMRYVVGFRIATSGKIEGLRTNTTGTTDQCLGALFQGLSYRAFSGAAKTVRVPFDMQ